MNHTYAKVISPKPAPTQESLQQLAQHIWLSAKDYNLRWKVGEAEPLLPFCLVLSASLGAVRLDWWISLVNNGTEKERRMPRTWCCNVEIDVRYAVPWDRRSHVALSTVDDKTNREWCEKWTMYGTLASKDPNTELISAVNIAHHRQSRRIVPTPDRRQQGCSNMLTHNYWKARTSNRGMQLPHHFPTHLLHLRIMRLLNPCHLQRVLSHPLLSYPLSRCSAIVRQDGECFFFTPRTHSTEVQSTYHTASDPPMECNYTSSRLGLT